MLGNARPFMGKALLSFTLCVFAPLGAIAQVGDDSFVTGAAQAAYQKWQTLLNAVSARDADQTEFFAAELLADNPSPLRLALLEERSLKRNENPGGILLFEQDHEAGALKEAGAKLYEALEIGREQMNEADDGWHFAAMGRFDVANANFAALLAAKPDPVAVLEFADRIPRRSEILIMLADHPVVGESARGMLRLLQEGEERIKSDPIRIKQNIERLDGAPRQFEYGAGRLMDSGEYAIPFLIQALRDPAQKELTQSILRTMPKIDRAGLNPLVMALRVDDLGVKTYVIQSLGKIGYWQSVPYLLALRQDKSTPPEIASAVDSAFSELAEAGVAVDRNMSAADAFLALANAYYENRPSLAADTRLDFANVWYWRDGLLQNVEVPVAIFDEIMCMRCCEEALRLNPDLKPALSLWVAANLRREAQLPPDATDYTRPDNYPSGAYFAQSAGAEYCMDALALAVDRQEAAVALGLIEALRKTAGPASMIRAEGRQPLAEALLFPDRMVRIRAALALAQANPREDFRGSQNWMPVLNEALMLHGGARVALVIDADSETANSVAAALRAAEYEVVIAASLFDALSKARNELTNVDLIALASDQKSPDLKSAVKSLRDEFRFASTPVLIVTKKADAEIAREVARSDPRSAQIDPDVSPEALAPLIARTSKAAGVISVTPEMGQMLALETAMALSRLAITNNPLIHMADAQRGLIAALGSSDADLRRHAATALGYVDSREAQDAIAAVAIDESEAEDMRVSMFAALADAAKLHGARLSDEHASRVREIAESDANLTIRTAASQALGALNLPSNPASTIIRNQYGG